MLSYKDNEIQNITTSFLFRGRGAARKYESKIVIFLLHSTAPASLH